VGLEIREQIKIAQSSPEVLDITLDVDCASSSSFGINNLLRRYNVYAVEREADQFSANNLV
jgi:hypothetical protein